MLSRNSALSLKPEKNRPIAFPSQAWEKSKIANPKSKIQFMFPNLLPLLLATVLTLASYLAVSLPAWATPSLPAPISTLPGLGKTFAGTPSQNLGVHNRQLSPCPASPNCVVSQNADTDHAIAPIAYQTDRDTARKALLQVLTVVPRTQVVEQTDDYIRFESTSRLLGFVDDGEFYFPEDASIIQVRSAARMGESDLGVNRRRLEQIRLALKDLGISP
jgi:uncharacterized protein (DUF1499 family)